MCPLGSYRRKIRTLHRSQGAARSCGSSSVSQSEPTGPGRRCRISCSDAERIAYLDCAVDRELFWIVTAWPDGPTLITSLRRVILFSGAPDTAFSGAIESPLDGRASAVRHPESGSAVVQ